jgi:protoheme IX farnesyltransferase
MKTAAITASELSLGSWSRLTERPADFVSLMKPRVILLAVFTALVGLIVAPGHLDPLLGFIAILAIAAGGGAAGVRLSATQSTSSPASHTPRSPKEN